ncbi:hypothetical protein AciPR4_0993 [Terriglobus saanensis SP1PR4]|uniref:Uncharacterized protein n=1 Tax=Terriglobus saanensis (strain ATCC BAA-1853 / DSM 23119 / SP1PR4) TaxID=401053 RepID=E8V8C3_TERSS|nr:hypothetical protein AciPR4_0993 [Terriglobus saanensis SP1PR4]
MNIKIVAFLLLFATSFRASVLSRKASGLSSAPACGLSFEGEVSEGQSFSHPGPGQLDFLLENIPSGWIIRVLPRDLPRSAYDFAGLATPPYDSPNPILISTDFAFRAQDAIGWNPRRFQYFDSAEKMRQAVADYNLIKASGAKPTAEQSAAMARLIALSAAASPAIFTILDAHLIGGTGDQFVMAAAVASHFSTTAHVVEQPSGPHSSPLGKITWMRFRLEFPAVDTGSHRSCIKAP